jgi:hypothetical protein
MQQRKKLASPLGQQVKGVLKLHEGADVYEQVVKLLKTLDCEVLAEAENRITIKASRGNLQSIKQCWLSNDKTNTLSQELNECITQITIGGRA